LANADLLPRLEDVVSVDDLRTFKPDPEVYAYLARRTDRALGETWLISSNAWDVIGAKAAGLRAAWIKRQPEAVFDPWDIDPDVVVNDLNELVAWFAGPKDAG
jgi:2-haloacid dehalogenase